MTGIVKLGLPGALRDYTVEQQGDGIAWERGPANPFAARVNSSGKYDEVDIWNDWAQEDWQAGVGRVDPEASGFLYAEAETRVPGQVILPPLVQQCDTRTINNTTADCRYMPSSVAGSVVVGNGGYAYVAIPFTTPSTLPTSPVSYGFYGRIPNGVQVKISTYSNSAGAPNAELASNTVTGDQPDKNFHWFSNTIANTSLSTSTLFWLVIQPVNAADTLHVAYGTSGYNTVSQGGNVGNFFIGTDWTALTGKYLLYTTGFHRLDPTNATSLSQGMIRFNGNLYAWVDDELYKYDSTNEQFDRIGTITDSTEGQPTGLLLLLTKGGASTITSAVVFGPTLYFGRAGGNYTTMDLNENFAGGSVPRTLFLEHAGYLYGAYENDLYYSVDGSTWSSAFQVGGDAYEIRGLAGMGGDLYMATDKALFRFAPGEIVEEAAVFGAIDSSNGVGMVEYQGSLYIPAGGRIFRYDESGQLMDIWVNRDDELPNSRIGRIAALTRMNNWLVAYVLPPLSGGRCTVWAWQEEGWHFLANGVSTLTASPVVENHTLTYDRSTQRLWITATGATPWFVEIEDYAFNPYNTTTYLYQPFGWIEQDRFYGGLYLVNKSWESVTVVGDNLSNDAYVQVYCQDENSTGWELVGSAQSDGEELRWSDYTARPTGKWIRIGVLLRSNSGTETPRVRAIIVKFLPYPNDRISDSLTLTLKSYVQMPDGTPNAYTLAQQRAHIETLVASVDPIIYQDPLGVRYEVTITSWRMLALKFIYENSTASVAELRVPLVLEQVPDSVYDVTLPFSDNFDRGEDAVGEGWIGSTWQIVNNAAVNTPTLGSEAITNGAFASDTAWTKGTGWSIAAGVATVLNPGGDGSSITQTALTTGAWYHAQFTVSVIALTDALRFITGTAQVSQSQITIVGTAAASFLATGTTAGVASTMSTGTSSIDNVSYKRLSAASLFLTKDFGVADVEVSAEVTVAPFHLAGIVLNLDDPANPQNYVVVFVDRGTNPVSANLYVVKCVSGVATQVDTVTSGFTYADGRVLKFVKSGTSYRVYYNGSEIVNLANTISDTTIISNTFHGLFSTNAGSSFDDISVAES